MGDDDDKSRCPLCSYENDWTVSCFLAKRNKGTCFLRRDTDRSIITNFVRLGFLKSSRYRVISWTSMKNTSARRKAAIRGTLTRKTQRM